MTTFNAIFIRDFSDESERAEQLLKENKINYVEMLSNSNVNEPTLIVCDSNYSYTGLEEITEYAQTLSNLSPICMAV